MFTKAIAPGVGLAEDPGQAESFGQNRCRILADAMIRAHEQGIRSMRRRLRLVEERFAADGLSIEGSQPHLCGNLR